jgi:hypothetical protein
VYAEGDGDLRHVRLAVERIPRVTERLRGQ